MTSRAATVLDQTSTRAGARPREDTDRRALPGALPPGPRTPRFLLLLRWTRNPVPVLDACARELGECFTIALPGTPPFVLFSNPAAIKDIFTGDPDDLRAGEANRILEPLVGANSLLILDGTRHRRERRLLLPPFHGERMQGYGATMREAAERSIGRWPLDRAFAIQPYLQAITLEVILRAVFGFDDGDEMEHLRRSVTRLLTLTSNPIWLAPWARVNLGPLTPWAGIERAGREVDELLLAQITRRRVEGTTGRRDVLSMLVDARDEEGAPMSDAELRDELITLLVAGHETTTAALAWTIHRLLCHPDVLARVRGELGRVVGAGTVGGAHAARLEYLDATVKETLRMHTVLPLVWRRLERPTRIGGHLLPAGVVAAAAIHLAHRRADVWSQPDRFLPDRFLGARPSPYEYLPFGGGVRRCIGMAFALFEMKIVLAHILQRVELRSPPGFSVRTVRRSIILAPASGLPVLARMRSS